MVSAAARGERAVRVSRRSERDDILAALKDAENIVDVRDLALTLWGKLQAMERALAAAHDREAALRAGLIAEQARGERSAAAQMRASSAEASAATAEARARAAEAQRDEARAAEDAALRREAAALRKLQTTEARLAQVGTAPPPRPTVEAVGQVTGAEVCLWVRQTRALSALRDVPAARWEQDDAAQLRRQVFRLQQHAPGAGRAALSERALELARSLGGA